MDTYHIGDLSITLFKHGSDEYTKASYPIRYGQFSEIKTPDYIFQFNLNGEIKFIQGLGKNWPDPLEWLKRTAGNDWIYYSTGGYSGVYDSYGEYYLPCPSYPSNPITVRDPFKDDVVKSAIKSWHELHAETKTLLSGSIQKRIRTFLTRVCQNSPEHLTQKARTLHNLVGERVTVLPPDTRHVDYEVIPLNVADGCLYKCGFCRVKSRKKFTPRTEEDILHQINALKRLYGQDIQNYNAVFLGQHDALNCDAQIIEFAANNAYNAFGFDRSYLKGAYLFLFGSVDSILSSNDDLFDSLDHLPFSTYINIGLESADPATLVKIKKSITAKMVEEAFVKMLDINRRYEKIEVSANFIFGEELPPSHLSSFIELTEKKLKHPYGKGAIYFSPLIDGGMEENRGLVRKFYRVKNLSPLATYIYLIQRL